MSLGCQWDVPSPDSQIIVFDELKLIIFVSQGLTLSTASLVYYFYYKYIISKFFWENIQDKF